jgi:hypothetical protein
MGFMINEKPAKIFSYKPDETPLHLKINLSYILLITYKRRQLLCTNRKPKIEVCQTLSSG